MCFTYIIFVAGNQNLLLLADSCLHQYKLRGIQEQCASPVRTSSPSLLFIPFHLQSRSLLCSLLGPSLSTMHGTLSLYSAIELVRSPLHVTWTCLLYTSATLVPSLKEVMDHILLKLSDAVTLKRSRGFQIRIMQLDVSCVVPVTDGELKRVVGHNSVAWDLSHVFGHSTIHVDGFCLSAQWNVMRELIVICSVGI